MHPQEFMYSEFQKLDLLIQPVPINKPNPIICKDHKICQTKIYNNINKVLHVNIKVIDLFTPKQK